MGNKTVYWKDNIYMYLQTVMTSGVHIAIASQPSLGEDFRQPVAGEQLPTRSCYEFERTVFGPGQGGKPPGASSPIPTCSSPSRLQFMIWWLRVLMLLLSTQQIDCACRAFGLL